jgi:nicotinamidase-related amidase
MTQTLDLRSRTEQRPGTDDWAEVTIRRTFAADRTALIICDMWDRHWSRGATERVDLMAPGINELASHLRDRGAVIIHAPSETLRAYGDHPARRRMAAVPRVQLPEPRAVDDPALPIDDSDGGSDTGETEPYKAWSCQHPAIKIADGDAISDDGAEIYGLLRMANITNVAIAGVHTNMCVLNRSFGIKNLVRWGLDPVLVRDLTDAMYNPAMAPYVSHERGTELVVEYIEEHWCPTVLSSELLTL